MGILGVTTTEEMPTGEKRRQNIHYWAVQQGQCTANRARYQGRADRARYQGTLSGHATRARYQGTLPGHATREI